MYCHACEQWASHEGLELDPVTTDIGLKLCESLRTADISFKESVSAYETSKRGFMLGVLRNHQTGKIRVAVSGTTPSGVQECVQQKHPSYTFIDTCPIIITTLRGKRITTGAENQNRWLDKVPADESRQAFHCAAIKLITHAQAELEAAPRTQFSMVELKVEPGEKPTGAREPCSCCRHIIPMLMCPSTMQETAQIETQRQLQMMAELQLRSMREAQEQEKRQREEAAAKKAAEVSKELQRQKAAEAAVKAAEEKAAAEAAVAVAAVAAKAKAERDLQAMAQIALDKAIKGRGERLFNTTVLDPLRNAEHQRRKTKNSNAKMPDLDWARGKWKEDYLKTIK